MNKSYQLMPHQEKQIKFLKSYNHHNNLFSKNISVQSPTGSGKSVMMLAYIKEYLEKNPYKKVYIATGFNELVWQLYDTAKEMGINTEILLGAEHKVCPKKLHKKGYPNSIYTEPYMKTVPDGCKFDAKECWKCKEAGTCNSNNSLSNIVSNYGSLVVTNHSCLNIFYKTFAAFAGGFIDECQAFGGFYESYLSIEITPNQIYNALDIALEYAPHNVKVDVLRILINKRQVTSEALLNFIEIPITVKKEDSVEECRLKDKLPSIFVREVNRFANLQSNYLDMEYYEHPQIDYNNQFCGIKVTRFFSKVNTPTNVCIISATVDEYTKNIFNIKDSYVETTYNSIDYTKSKLIIYDEYSIENLKSFIDRQTADHGLILFTRLDLVKELKHLRKLSDYEIITRKEQFVSCKKQILVGSKSLFQGVDIPNIGFVAINKLPFDRYDFQYKKKMKYFEHMGLTNSSWDYYTIPYVVNQTIQTMGRLWRQAGDYGEVAIFDKAAKDKFFTSITVPALTYRPGLKYLSL